MRFSPQIWNQAVRLLILSVMIGVGQNYFRNKPLNWLAQPLETVSDLSLIMEPSYTPIIKNIQMEMAQILLENNIPFVDARANEYYEQGHIPHAMPSDDVETLVEKLDEKVGLFNPFVVYCSDDDCGSSEALASQLQDEGFMNILVFKGGWKEWSIAKLPIEINESE
ncbi:MAG: rhodanese-like domain-containing protein [Candidatus Marinimicrobia bacterium]|jgi:rhodanese-related sulfurtransferase|nr:rhodanese-like domain-containing protein [Candidatus Neomarinimicrobiota bacterium]MBT3496651.1 rhodanese-like domain-containing protein [Candidatus Neomarinimicrobiota bacterium]MBT3691725.1 rhodanese-like domain-containing protein [Candidatus Neomarinimicrobiota bacterium]MBT3732199.1 rhodanese-like domain-containing protein [Candidatus Neomarinimicrobiota bacterium]MBT4144639.1 rhodanese-like domain-containing protein [Candidatus Neomarinimicrobiota bacterium]